MFILGLPPTIINLVQSGLIERAFYDALFPELKFRAEAQFEEWPANTGTELFQSRPGLLAVNTTPLRPGVDPTPQTLSWEQWRIILERFGDTIDVNTQDNAVAVANLFYRTIQQLGLQAGQSMNRVPRDTLFKAYCSGQTVLTAAAAAIDTQVHVASLNGFSDFILLGTDVRPTLVSVAHPMPCTLGTGGAAQTVNVIATVPDNALDPDGPGWLVLNAAIGGGGVLARTPIVTPYAPLTIRVGGGASVDAVGAADTFTMQNAIVAANLLRNNNVPPHDDGTYHAHIAPTVNAQAFTDTAFQRLFTSMPDSEEMKRGVLGTIGNVKFILNSENPQWQQGNCGALTSTSTGSALYGSSIGAEVMNHTGVAIARTIVTGKGALYERGLDEKNYQTEAGVTGKIGEFQIVNSGMSINTQRISLIIRAPLNRTQNMVSCTWTTSTGFACPSDAASGTTARYKRAIVIECAS